MRRSWPVVALLLVPAAAWPQSRPLEPFRPAPERSFTAFYRPVEFVLRESPAALVSLDFDQPVWGARLVFPPWREKGVLSVAYGRQEGVDSTRPSLSLLDLEVQAWADLRLAGTGRAQLKLSPAIFLTYRRFGLGPNVADVGSKGLLLGGLGVGLAVLARLGPAVVFELRGAPGVGLTFVKQEGLSLPPPNLFFDAESGFRFERVFGAAGLTVGGGLRAARVHVTDSRLFAPSDDDTFRYRTVEPSLRLGLSW